MSAIEDDSLLMRRELAGAGVCVLHRPPYFWLWSRCEVGMSIVVQEFTNLPARGMVSRPRRGARHE